MQLNELKPIDKKILDEIKYFLLLGYEFEGASYNNSGKFLMSRKFTKGSKHQFICQDQPEFAFHMVDINLETPMNKTTTNLVCEKAQEVLFSDYYRKKIIKSSTFTKIDENNFEELKNNLKECANDFNEKSNLLLNFLCNINYSFCSNMEYHIKSEAEKMMNYDFDISNLKKVVAKIDNEKIEKQNKVYENDSLNISTLS